MIQATATKVVAGLLAALVLALIAAKFGDGTPGAATLKAIRAVPWFYIGVLVAALVAFFAGGAWVQVRAIRRSQKLVHRLARRAPRTDDFDRVEWVFGFLRANTTPVIVEGYILSKRRAKDGETLGFLQIDEGQKTTCWCACDRNGLTFRNAREEKRITLSAHPLGVIGNELFFIHSLMENREGSASDPRACSIG